MSGDGRAIGGRYELVSKIAEGGMGSVWRARHTLSRKMVALKVIQAETARDETTRQRFLREVAAPAHIGHRGIVEVYDAGFDAGSGALFVAMELLEGQTLRQLLEGGPVPRERVYSIFLRLLEPLAAAHAAGFVHRDLKPENVFLQRVDGVEHVKLLDFGIARHLRADSESVTATGVAIGTPHYMSPEQAASARDVTCTADVWAVGVMLYEALAGSPPFRGDTLASLVVDVLTRPQRPLDEVAPGVAPAVARVIDHALDKSADKRPPDAGALLTELRRALESGARPTAPIALPTTQPIPPSALPTTQPIAPSAARATDARATAPTMALDGSVPGGVVPSTSGLSTAPPTTPSLPVSGATASGYGSSPGVPKTVGIAPLSTPMGTPSTPGQVAPSFSPSSGPSPAGLGSSPGGGSLPGGGSFVPGSFGPGAGPSAGAFGSSGGTTPGATVGVGGATQPGAAPSRSRTALFVLLGLSVGGVGLVGLLALALGSLWLWGGGETRHGTLAIGDPMLATMQLYDAHEFTWSVGDRVTLDVASGQFDPRLMVQTPSGRHYDDDPSVPGAHLELVIDETGPYHVLVTGTRFGDTGDYDLTVRQR